MGAKKTVSDGDIQALKQLLHSTNAQVFGPSDDGYAATIQRWSRAAEKPAGVSILPTTSEEVSIAVKYATEHQLDLAVKGGGHSTAGASSTNGGVLINLSNMRNVHVDPEKQLLHVQGGALWSDVDSAAWNHGLATVGGTVSDTGVGGLTLGGGYGHLTGSHGLVIDNTVGATVVLADGTIAEASKTTNPDLFWGLLGAGQNFGVTTKFIFQAFPQNEIFTGMMLFPPIPETIQKVVAACNDLYTVRDTPSGPRTKIGGKGMTLLALAKPPPAGGATLLLCIFSYNGSEEDGKRAFNAFYDAGPIENTLAMHPYPKVNNLVPAVQGARSSMKGASFLLPIRPEFVMTLMSEFDSFASSNPDAQTSLVAFELYDAVKTTELENGTTFLPFSPLSLFPSPSLSLFD